MQRNLVRRPAGPVVLSACTALCCFTASRSAGATVVWTSTFEADNLSEWAPGINNTVTLAGGVKRNNVEVVTPPEPVYSGRYACKITLHLDDLFTYGQNRVDIQHQSTLTAEGADTWISGHYFMPTDAHVRNEFAFWESNMSYQNVMDFWVEPKQGGGPGTTVNFGVGFLGASVVWSAGFEIGKWHQVAMHVHWSTNPQLGKVDVWFDGQQVVTGYSSKTKADANTLFFQNGLHRKTAPDAGGVFVDVLYLDDFVEADSFADAKIAAPVQPATDAGLRESGMMEAGSSSDVAAAATDASMAISGSTSGSGSSSGSSSPSGSPFTSGVSSGVSGGLAGSAGAPGGAGAGAPGGTLGMSVAPAATGGKSGCSVSCAGPVRSSAFGIASLIGAFAAGVGRKRRRRRTT